MAIVGVVRAKSARRRDIQSAVNRAVALAGGKGGRGQAVARGIWLRVGLQALSLIKEAFLVKARGGTDEAGDKWPALSPATIAYSRRNVYTTKGGKTAWVPKAGKRAEKAPSWALTKEQRDRWWALYRGFGGGAPGGKAYHAKGQNRGWAAALAWIELKKEYGPNITLMAKYGKTVVDILRSTGLLYNSLSPGINLAVTDPTPTSVPKVREQVFRPKAGEVMVGTNRKWAGVHHEGKGHCPQRRLWPHPNKWPARWWKLLLSQARQGLIEVAISLFK